MMKLIFATGNIRKLDEAREILGSGYSLIGAAEAGISEEIPETGDSLEANSRLKAQYVADRLAAFRAGDGAVSGPVPESTSGPLSDPDGRDICGCFADDTGLEVELLNGAPGVRSARYAGEAHDDEANMDRLLAEMALREREASVIRAYGMATPKVSRRARFRTVITLLLDGKQYCFNGIVEGRMACGRRGCHGFGYDPIFVPDEIPAPGGRLVPNTGRLTMAELSEAEKNAISHRGRALRAMAEFLRGK